MTAMKKTYVWIEVIAGPKIRGCDSCLTTWDSYLGLINEVMDQHETLTVKLTVLHLTDAEYDRFCLDNEIDV